jgi:D-serine deaminase-like pyridoxal phosphate-dependent protein
MNTQARVSDYETPLVTVDLDAVEHNIKKVQGYFDQHGIALRPHIKTHKIAEFTRQQLAAGAGGICCQKLSEAEVMVDEAGATDIFIPFNLIGPKKVQRLAELARRPGVTITVAADSQEAAHSAQEAAKLAGRPIRVLIECDTGGKRAGLPTPQEVFELGLNIKRECDMVELAGLFTFPTHLTKTPAFFQEASRLLEAQGIKLQVYSGGGTPVQWKVGGLPYITEHRAGTYIYNDRNTLGAGACTLEECAMRVVCTVVSRPTDTRAIIDGGSKTFSSDPWLTGPPEAKYTFGLVLEYPEAVFAACSEEHGTLDLAACRDRPKIGEQITIIPNHCCTTTNMHDLIYGVRDGKVAQVFQVAARGKVW